MLQAMFLFDGVTPLSVGLILLAVIIVVFLVFFGLSYTVVPPHEAHVVVSRGKGKKVFCARSGYKSAYWKVPIIQQRAVLPIENVQIKVPGVPLRDKNMAKFFGDVVAWLNISVPELAAERLGRLVAGFKSIEEDIINLIQAVTRNESMYWTIIDIITKRKEFSEGVQKAVNKELEAWGMVLVELEVIHFIDTEGYTVIKDLEQRQAVVINAETRKQVAEKTKEASIVESSALKETELIRAKNEEEYRTRQIQKEEMLGKREQEKEMIIAEETQKANAQRVEAERTLTVGKAEITKQATITEAEGQAQAQVEIGQAKAEVTKKTGQAEADVVKAKGFAEAESTDKRAEALRKYNEAGITLELLKAVRDVELSRWDNWGKAMQQADVRVYSGGESGALLGMPLSAQSGFNLGAFSSVAKEQGFDIQKVLESIAKGVLPVADVSKLAEKKEQPQEEEQKKQGDVNVERGKRDTTRKA
jgi:flotillin